VLALLGWFGSGAGPWSGHPSYEAAPEQLLLHYPTQLLVEALTATVPTAPQWAGAARYFAGWDFRKMKKGDGQLLAPARGAEATAPEGGRGDRDRGQRGAGEEGLRRLSDR
jgi:hypothetical protein